MTGEAPIPRRAVVVGCVATVALVLAALVGLEAVRHPPLLHAPGGAVDQLDPRREVDCPEPAPREGEGRAEGSVQARVEPVTARDLLDCPHAWDGRRVRYAGEAVGAVIRRRAGTWLQLNDDVYAGLDGALPRQRVYAGANTGVGVLVPADVGTEVELLGGPRARGDRVEVVGTFRRVDPATGEVAVIHAHQTRVVATGHLFDHGPLPTRDVAAAVLVLVAVACAAVERLDARSLRRGRRR